MNRTTTRPTLHRQAASWHSWCLPHCDLTSVCVCVCVCVRAGTGCPITRLAKCHHLRMDKEDLPASYSPEVAGGTQRQIGGVLQGQWTRPQLPDLWPHPPPQPPPGAQPRRLHTHCCSRWIRLRRDELMSWSVCSRQTLARPDAWYQLPILCVLVCSLNH